LSVLAKGYNAIYRGRRGRRGRRAGLRLANVRDNVRNAFGGFPGLNNVLASYVRDVRDDLQCIP
jgi:hypothetical protein